MQFNDKYPETTSLSVKISNLAKGEKDPACGSRQVSDPDLFFLPRERTTTNCPSNRWESQPICRKHQEMNLSAATKSMNKHLENWRTEMEWRERDPTWGVVYRCLVSRIMEIWVVEKKVPANLSAEARSSPAQHTCNQRQVLWLWKSTVNPTNHSQSKLWITRKTTPSNIILNLELLGHFWHFPMLNYAFRVHSLTFGHYRSLSALHLRKE